TLDLFFDEADMLNDSANLDLEVVFGKVTIFVPSNWQVILTSDVVLSNEEIVGKPNNPNKKLYINDELVFSKLNIIYL
ncbi:MAG: hypothetical protein WBO70_07880, partial [Erysipelotrichaceae bacterium]